MCDRKKPRNSKKPEHQARAIPAPALPYPDFCSSVYVGRKQSNRLSKRTLYCFYWLHHTKKKLCRCSSPDDRQPLTCPPRCQRTAWSGRRRRRRPEQPHSAPEAFAIRNSAPSRRAWIEFKLVGFSSKQPRNNIPGLV